MSLLVFSIKDTETLSDRPKNFLLSQVNKGQILNCYCFLHTIPLLCSQDYRNAPHVNSKKSHNDQQFTQTFQTEFFFFFFSD